MKKTIELTTSDARKIFPNASPEMKELLLANFTKEELSGKITDRIKTYEDACEALGIVPLNEATLRNAGLTEHEIAGRKIATITKALNEGWVPNWDNSNERKWRPWFVMSSSRFAFNAAFYDYSYAFAGFASRLCFKSEELAIYAAKQFTDLYKIFMLD